MRGARQARTARARELRRVDNDAELLLWRSLRGRRLNGFKFVRQLPIGPYFADFACREAGLVVEVDGSQHAGSDHDCRRDRFMCHAGCSVLRFWNMDVLLASDEVLETILAVLDGRLVDAVASPDLRFMPAVKG